MRKRIIWGSVQGKGCWRKRIGKKINFISKLKEIENPDGDMGDGNQIEFGINSENLYYTDDNENNPEVSNKFNNWKFNQFTYILFKNFKSKGISYKESKLKWFDLIVEGYTKIILEMLNYANNNYNYALTKIFVSALFFNSECDMNKLIFQ